MKDILDWSEVWALLLPLSVLLFGKSQPRSTRPVVLYVVLAFAINLTCDLIWKFGLLQFDGVSYNGFLYNAHSILRFVLFSIYVIRLGMHSGAGFRQAILGIFLLFVIVNFGLVESFFNPRSPFSSTLFVVESVLTLVLCLQYYFSQSTSEEQSTLWQPDFWILTGWGFFVVTTFLIFLFYDTIARISIDTVIFGWDVHNGTYIVFNCFIAKALYEAQRKRSPVYTGHGLLRARFNG